VDPVLEAEEEFAVVVRQAGEEVEVVVLAHRPDGTGNHAQVAAVARVVVERVVVAIDRRVDQHRLEEHEVAQARVDDVAVQAHVPHAGLHRDGLVGQLPRPGTRLVRWIHREAD